MTGRLGGAGVRWTYGTNFARSAEEFDGRPRGVRQRIPEKESP